VRPDLAPPRRQQGGFTLVEVLVVIVILGIIAYPLTEAVILGFRTTDGTIAGVSRASAVELLAPAFTSDAQNAVDVAVSGGACAAVDPGDLAGVFLDLAWTDGATPKEASYALVPPTGGEQDLVRLSCVNSGPARRQVLGHFSHDPAAPSPPVSAACTPACNATAKTITLHVQLDPSATPAPPVDITVRRRTA
jgi:prepilin-type N-terminal cleavage/methylation domain-containing protein